MEIFNVLIEFLSNLNDQEFLIQLTEKYGTLLYAILFLIIMTETGLVVMPLLPGDSLLFAVGALCAATNNAFNIWIVIPLLIVAALVGDNINYFVGHKFGNLLRKRKRLLFFRHEYLERTEEFYAKHGGKTVIMARFVPIVRTIAPFVAGAGSMKYSRYIFYCIAGAILWVVGVSLLGYAFGNIPLIKDNFEIVIVAIILLSLVPVLLQFVKRKKPGEDGK
ncbi:MAG: DedA family protein [Saprospirales bacterium]|jgi:membrane-associated protein|nr:DedA family protein [Saprospirales bacterium]MBK7337161.1 DedA family protein [Saprospirales bacterium]